MKPDLSRLLRPKSIAVVGGGAWCAQIILQSRRMNFSGRIDVVNPRGAVIEGVQSVMDMAGLSAPPDAVFVGVNRIATVDVVRSLSAMGAGGAVCFASGFSESAAEDEIGVDLQAALVAAAGDMPVFGAELLWVHQCVGWSAVVARSAWLRCGGAGGRHSYTIVQHRD